MSFRPLGRVVEWPEMTDCGVLSYRPRFLRWLNKPKYFVFLFGITSLFATMGVGATSFMIPTLETQFKWNSKETGEAK